MKNKLTMALIATLYYKNNLSQNEIAKKMNVSRPWISKLLKKAQDAGMVKITIQSPLEGHPDLERQIEEAYGLSHVKVIDDSSQEDYLSLSAASYLMAILQDKDTIGLGWGSSVARFVEACFPMEAKEIKTVALAGSFGTPASALPNYQAIQLAQKLSATPVLLHAPAFCVSKENYDALMENDSIRESLYLAEHADILITGIGSSNTSFLTHTNLLTDEAIEELKSLHVIGDILLQHFNADLEPVSSSLTQHMIKANIYEARKHARCIMALAQGVEKAESIHAVLSSGLVDVFFTDTKTANVLIAKKIQ